MCISQSLSAPVCDSQEIELELAKIKWSNKQIDAIGESLRDRAILLNQKTSPDLLVISDWRSSHELAMKRVMASLKRHANEHGTAGVIYGRAKRMSSIASKLGRLPNMALSTMQDIAGCRVVVESASDAELFAASIRSELAQKLSRGGAISERSYIQSPKLDGYRSIHFIVRYKPLNLSPDVQPRKVEIQVRSTLQHQWATALETVDLFTTQTLKVGGGDARWRRFFALSSGIFASKENRPAVPGLPLAYKDLLAETNKLARELHVAKRLQGWSDVMRDVLEGSTSGALGEIYSYLVELHVDENKTHIKKYGANQLQDAHENYLQSEMQNANSSTRSSVLATAYSFSEVRKAFPGYYGDTKAFLRALQLTQ
ncbi:MAG: hypothetical protein JWQ49_4795 [Edaphobacter sp.]|nr:hypothetical protein [Edaphobacter sp.]